MPRRVHASLDLRSGGKSVILENESVRMVIMAERGSDVSELVYKPLNVDVLWHYRGGSGPGPGRGGVIVERGPEFEDYYCGGWQDLLPSIGLPTELHGAKFGLHGETFLLPWDAEVEEDSGVARAVLRVSGVRYPYSVEKTISIGEGTSRVDIAETLTNTSKQTLDFYWLQHPAFGEPFLAPGCRLELPEGSRGVNMRRFGMKGRVAECEFDWPTASAEAGGSIDLSEIPQKKVVAEETTFLRPKEGWYELTNPRLGLKTRFEWDASVFRWVWFWQNYGAPDYPYFGSGWNVAVEPATSLPTILGEQAVKDAVLLDGGQSITTKIGVSLEPTGAG